MDDKCILLHVCCAPDATHSLKVLQEKYNFEIYMYFYNPNIQPREEYKKRYDSFLKLSKQWDIPYIEAEYNPEDWFKITELYKDEPEGGARCFLCYKNNLFYTAKKAKELGIKYFSTTLTISPHKNADIINSIGEEVAKLFGITYVPENFKKNDGFKKSIEYSKELGLYRQNYCGCIYSKMEMERKRKVSYANVSNNSHTGNRGKEYRGQ